MEATPHWTVAVRPPASHIKKHSSEPNTTCRTLPEKQGRIHK